jgi:hypothetical protein
VVKLPAVSTLKTVPQPTVFDTVHVASPAYRVVPYKKPSFAWSNASLGVLPSAPPVNEYNVLRFPAESILKIVPDEESPPPEVVP